MHKANAKKVHPAQTMKNEVKDDLCFKCVCVGYLNTNAKLKIFLKVF